MELNFTQIASCIYGKCILVTGAGGSIGSELCRQLIKLRPAKLILLGKGENSIYEIYMELKGSSEYSLIETEIADIRDKKRIEDIFEKHRPQVFFHAAAHKHVPLMEAQPG